MKVFPLTLAIILASLAVSCATRQIDIPYDLTPMELIQRAQEASDRNRYGISMQYYEAILERFPFDIDNIIAAEYEIAFIHYKQNRFDTARVQFEEILARYDNPDGALLPPQFRILSGIVLANMDEIESRRRPRSRM
ncbi:MAG: hypothetical protein FWH12_07090 [Treponema sp.]|nr:hypothetical protein [Treponema sp.]